MESYTVEINLGTVLTALTVRIETNDRELIASCYYDRHR